MTRRKALLGLLSLPLASVAMKLAALAPCKPEPIVAFDPGGKDYSGYAVFTLKNGRYFCTEIVSHDGKRMTISGEGCQPNFKDDGTITFAAEDANREITITQWV